MGEFARFVLVGGTGFLVDGGVLTWLLEQQWSLGSARLVSFALAVSWTYVLNRTITFKLRRACARVEQGTALGYFMVQCCGASANYGVFLVVLILQPELRAFAWLPLAIGSVFGLAVNYTGSKLLFHWRKQREFSG